MIEEMKKIAAQIGQLELMRSQGIYVPITRIDKLKREFKKLSVRHKQQMLNF